MAIVELASSSPDVRVGHRGPIVASCFYSWPNGELLKSVTDAQREVAKTFGPCFPLTIIPPVDLKAAQARAANSQFSENRDAVLKESAELSADVESLTRAAAMVILPRGAVAVMISAFMAAFALVSRSRTPLKTFRTLEEAIRWLEEQGAPHSPGLLRDLEAWLALPTT
jgi:hypothetical protein